MSTLLSFIVIFGFLFIYLKSVRIIPQNFKGLVYRLGRLDERVREPGFNLLLPFIDELKLICTRHEIMNIPSEILITQDNKNLNAEVNVHLQITDPKKTINVTDPYEALKQTVQTNLRIEIGKVSSSMIASEQESLNRKIQDLLNYSAKNWGMQINRVELKNLVYL